MRVVVTGAHGQLGYDVCREFEKDYEVIGLHRQKMDITSPLFPDLLKSLDPDIVINCAALLAPQCEDDPDLALDTNYMAVTKMAKAVPNALFVQLSTDYVFGRDTSQGFYTESDWPNPINTYGRTKKHAEKYLLSRYDCIVVRTSALFGHHAKHNFVKTMLSKPDHSDVYAVTDQITSPTYTVDLASLIHTITESGERGIFHCTNDGYCSFYEFAQQIFIKSGKSVNLIPVKQSYFESKLQRPLMTVLDSIRPIVLNNPLRSWRDALDAYLAERLSDENSSV